MPRQPLSILLQSGALPYRHSPSGLQILLITSSSGKKWLVPKGHREPFLTPQDNAAKEAYEEAGVLGHISPRPIGHWSYEKDGLRRLIEVFPLNVLDVMKTWPEANRRLRQWLDPRRAARQVSDPQLAELIRALPEFLEAHPADAAFALASF